MGKIICINNNWKFYLGDDFNADYMGYDDSAWRKIDLPHDWSVEHPFSKSNASGTGYLPGGTAWYRKHFNLPEDAENKCVRVTFGGVYKNAKVYINSNYLGKHPYGYTSFTYDISEFVKKGENVLSVRVEHNEVADSRWFTGSGIYRDVKLEISEKCHFADNGVFVTTEKIENGNALLSIDFDTVDCDEAEFVLENSNGELIATAGLEAPCGKAYMSVANAELWSLDSPNLYKLHCNAFKNNRICDSVTITTGIRTIKFDADEGFFLNGECMKLKGVCVHHDAGALGAAVPVEVWKRRLEKFKECGCNAIRTAHNPPDEKLISLCDEMGFFVMDEAFDEWEGSKNKWWQGHNVYPPKRFGYAEDFPQWHKVDLESMVLRDRNHPSVILWSIGNEIDYPNDPYVTPLFTEVLGNNDSGKPADERKYDDKKPDARRLAVVAKELVEIVHSIDTSRPVLSAMSFPELSTRTGFADVLDVSGYNYRENLYEEDHKRFPERVIFGSENGHDPKAWYTVRDNDYICGQFLWTGIDFLGECKGFPLRISQAGMLDLCGNPKPLFYRRKALWTEEPFVKIAVSKGDREKTNTWTDKFIYSGEENEKMQVSCYTNQSSAEMFLNGVSLGKKDVTDTRATWEIPFTKGELKAKVSGAEDVLLSSEKAEELKLNVYNKSDDVVQIEVSLLDKNGNIAAHDELVYYQLLGDGRILGIENGKPDDLTPYFEKFRKTFGGKAIVYIKKGNKTDSLTLFAYTENGIENSIKLKGD